MAYFVLLLIYIICVGVAVFWFYLAKLEGILGACCHLKFKGSSTKEAPATWISISSLLTWDLSASGSTPGLLECQPYLKLIILKTIYLPLIARFMGPTWGPPGDPGGPHVCHMNFAIWVWLYILHHWLWIGIMFINIPYLLDQYMLSKILKFTTTGL